MIGHDQNIFFRRIFLNGPTHKIDKGLRIPHICFANTFDHRRSNGVYIIILSDKIPAGIRPVAVSVECSLGAIQLNNNIHLRVGTNQLHLIDIKPYIAFQNFIVCICIDDDRPLRQIRCIGRDDHFGWAVYICLGRKPKQCITIKIKTGSSTTNTCNTNNNRCNYCGNSQFCILHCYLQIKS